MEMQHLDRFPWNTLLIGRWYIPSTAVSAAAKASFVIIMQKQRHTCGYVDVAHKISSQNQAI